MRKFGTAIWLDLPGCGKNSPISSYKMRDLSSIISVIYKKLALKNVYLIGLNNGDNITIDTVLHHSLEIEGLLEWDAKSAGTLTKITCPTLCILTDEHHCSYEKMHREAPQFEIGKVIGSKCWAALEVPEQINAMIARFLKIHASLEIRSSV